VFCTAVLDRFSKLQSTPGPAVFPAAALFGTYVVKDDGVRAIATHLGPLLETCLAAEISRSERVYFVTILVRVKEGVAHIALADGFVGL
jgi:hypothetical protein